MVVGVGVAYAVGAAWWWHDSRFAFWASTVMLIALPFLGGVVAVRRGLRLRSRSRQAWVLLGAGACVWSLGQAAYSFYEVVLRTPAPFPGPSDLGFLAAVVLLAAGVRRYPTLPHRRWSLVRSGIDTVIIMVSALLIGWETSLETVYRTASEDRFAWVVGLAYPGGDVLVISMVLLLLRHTVIGDKGALRLLLTGMFLLVFADTGFALLVQDGTYETGHWIDAGWGAGLAMIGVAATYYRVEDEPLVEEVPTRLGMLVPYLAAVLALGTATLQWTRGDPVDRFEVVFGLGALLLLLGRQSILVLDGARLAAELRAQTLHDGLTGLANRRLLVDRIGLAARHRARSRGTMTLLYIDLDDFKSVNDDHGHPAGDRYLVETARRLVACARPADTVARLGGDEFAVLLDGENLDPRNVPSVVHRFSDALAEPTDLGGTIFRGSASIGSVTLTGADEFPGVEALMRNADLAMYVAKRAGKGTSAAFQQHMHEDLVRRTQLKAELSQAIERGDLVVHFQPIVDLQRRTTTSVEALLRWDHPVRGLLTPDAFLPVAESMGLLPLITRLVLVEACEWAAEHRGDHPDTAPVAVAVNLTASEMSRPETIDLVTRTLAATALPPELLCLEVTETSIFEDLEASIAAVAGLHRIGVKIALDDFGTGRSSLARLKLLSVDSVKIDRSFIDGLGVELEDTTFVSAVLKLVKTLGLHVVAEGVETETQLQVLSDLGCDAVQGLLLAPPCPAPAAIPPGLEGRMARILGPRATTSGPGPAYRTVLVDDDDQDRRLVQRFLERSGRFVVVGQVADGESGLALVERLHPDVVLLDLNMPGLDALEALGRMVATRPAPRVVVVSGYAAGAPSERALKAGALAVIDKRESDLVDVLLRALDDGLPVALSAAGQSSTVQ